MHDLYQGREGATRNFMCLGEHGGEASDAHEWFFGVPPGAFAQMADGDHLGANADLLSRNPCVVVCEA
jgi:hypothetical protein